MSIKTSNKMALLLAAVPLASANLYAGELGSYLNEVKVNDYDNGDQKIEWTVAKGSYKLSDNYTFIVDADKDFVDNADGTKTQGWDTQFGLVQATGINIAGFDVDVNYLVRYDASWNEADGSDSSHVEQYIVSPWLSKDVSIAGKDFSLGIEIWAQGGAKNNGSLQDYSGVEANFYLDGALSDNWELNLAWYNFDYYNADADQYDYQIGTEDYLTYSLELAEGFTFSVETMLEAYYTPDSEDLYANVHIKPQVKYTSKVNDSLTYHVALGYEVVDYLHLNSEDTTGTTSWSGNEMELTVGFKFK